MEEPKSISYFLQKNPRNTNSSTNAIAIRKYVTIIITIRAIIFFFPVSTFRHHFFTIFYFVKSAPQYGQFFTKKGSNPEFSMLFLGSFSWHSGHFQHTTLFRHLRYARPPLISFISSLVIFIIPQVYSFTISTTTISG